MGFKILISHEEEKEMLAAHALGALEVDEARLVEEHLRGCAECRAEMEEWRETAAALVYTAEAAEPSPALRARILETVSAASPAPASNGKEAEATVPSNVIAMPRPVRSRAPFIGALAA